MKYLKTTNITLEQFWNARQVSMGKLLFRLLFGCYLLWNTLDRWNGKYTDNSDRLIYALMGICGVTMLLLAVRFIKNYHLTRIFMALTGTLPSVREDFQNAEELGAAMRLGREYLFCIGMQPVAYRNIRGFVYWDSKLYYRNKHNHRRLLSLEEIPADAASELIARLESRIRDNADFIPTEYVPATKLPLGKRIRKVLSYVIPSLIVERKVAEHSAGLGTLILHLLSVFSLVIGGILMWLSCMMLFVIPYLFPLRDTGDIMGFLCVLFVLPGWGFFGAKMLFPLPVSLFRLSRKGELSAVIRDFNASEQVFPGMYIGNKYLFKAGAQKILVLKEISNVYAARQGSRRTRSIYYDIPNIGANTAGTKFSKSSISTAKYLCGIPRGYTVQETVALLRKAILKRNSHITEQKEQLRKQMREIMEAAEHAEGEEKKELQMQTVQLYKELLELNQKEKQP